MFGITMASEEECLSEPCEIVKVQRKKSISAQLSSQPHCQDQVITVSVYISLRTKLNSSILTVKVQRHKDLMEYIDLAHAP